MSKHITSDEIPDGSGSPEGVLAAVPATIYRDLDSGDLWVKKDGTSVFGWSRIAVEAAPSQDVLQTSLDATTYRWVITDSIPTVVDDVTGAVVWQPGVQTSPEPIDYTPALDSLEAEIVRLSALVAALPIPQEVTLESTPEPETDPVVASMDVQGVMPLGVITVDSVDTPLVLTDVEVEVGESLEIVAIPTVRFGVVYGHAVMVFALIDETSDQVLVEVPVLASSNGYSALTLMAPLTPTTGVLTKVKVTVRMVSGQVDDLIMLGPDSRYSISKAVSRLSIRRT